MSYTLAISTVTPQGIQPGEAVTSTLRQDTLWAFDGQAGQPLNASVRSATGGAPSLTLQMETGEALRYSDGNAIAAFFPPQTGRYYLRVGGLDQTTRYTLALEDLQPPTIAFGETVTSTTHDRRPVALQRPGRPGRHHRHDRLDPRRIRSLPDLARF